ncbi:MAG: EcsC family protein [Paracoccus sp. (in: a-proteobacteria)]|nr:EcsC family protein [Paracoccus sp. (in: a-proteobacteria)]
MAALNQVVLPPITDPTVLAAIERLARRYVDASGMAMDVLQSIGTSAEGLIARLPGPVRSRLDRITSAALSRAFDAAAGSRRVVRDRGDWFNRMASTLSGAAGGAGGLAGALIETPLTVTLMSRAILEIAAEHGFSPEDHEVRAEALRVFAAAGPIAADDATDLGMLAAKLSVTGQTIQGLIARVAPRLSAALGQKLAAQAVPVLGAFAGASINYTFTRYYQELARVHFGLMQLSQESGIPKEALNERLRMAILSLQDRQKAVRRA